MSWNSQMIWEELEIAYQSSDIVETDTTLNTTVADALLVRNLRQRHIVADYQQRDQATGLDGAQEEDMANLRAEVEYEIEAGPAGTAGLAPAYDVALLSCGLTKTVVADTSVTYKPTPPGTALASTEIKLWSDRVRQRMPGARGSLSFSMQNGQKPFFGFRKVGMYLRPLAGARHVPDFSAWQPALLAQPSNFAAGAFTMDGETGFCLRSFSFTDGRNPIVGRYINCPEIDIRARRYTGRMVIEFPAYATRDIVGELAGANAIQPLLVRLGRSAGQYLEIAAPKVQMKYAGVENLEGSLGLAIDLVFLPSAGDDEISIIFK